jgi:hypothetical protein
VHQMRLEAFRVWTCSVDVVVDRSLVGPSENACPRGGQGQRGNQQPREAGSYVLGKLALLKNATSQSKDVIWEIRDKGNVALCQEVGLKKISEVQTGKEKDLVTRTIEGGKKGFLVDPSIGVKEDETLLTTAHGGSNQSITGMFVEGPMEVRLVEAAEERPIERWDCSSWDRSGGEQDGWVP